MFEPNDVCATEEVLHKRAYIPSAREAWKQRKKRTKRGKWLSQLARAYDQNGPEPPGRSREHQETFYTICEIWKQRKKRTKRAK